MPVFHLKSSVRRRLTYMHHATEALHVFYRQFYVHPPSRGYNSLSMGDEFKTFAASVEECMQGIGVAVPLKASAIFA